MTPKTIIIHHSVSNRDKTTLNNINEWHRVRFNFKSSLGYFVAYHYVILGSGKIVQTRQDNEIGAHTIPNEGKLGICLTGNFEGEQPSQAQLSSLKNLLMNLKQAWNLTNNDIYPHNYYSATLCPGKNLLVWLDNYKKQDLGFIQKQLFDIQQMINKLFALLSKIRV